MSHITFKMCQFELIIYLRDYHYDFYLDIVVLWSFYGVLRLTYTIFQNLCPTDHFFGRLLMSQDISPNWMVLLEFTYRIIQIFFCILPMSNIVLFSMYVSYRLQFPKLPIFLSDVNIPNPNFLMFFIFPSGPSASFANCH